MDPVLLHKKNANVKKLNWLRAGVLGANDGVVSEAGLLLGVVGATSDLHVILAAGIAGIIAGAISMAAGEYVSVSSSKDTEKALIAEEKYELENNPKEELKELAKIYEHKGLSPHTAAIVAKELSIHDAAAAHFDAELGIDPNNLTSPVHAAIASAVAFFLGSVVPLIFVTFPPAHLRAPVAFVAVLITLVLISFVSAKVSGANFLRVVVRIIIFGALAMGITYIVGKIFAVSGL